MAKATWYFADRTSYTTGASGDLFTLVFAGHKIARRKNTLLVGWKFSSKIDTRLDEAVMNFPWP